MAQQIPVTIFLARKADDIAALAANDKPFVFNLFEAFYDPAAVPAASLRPLK
jgi:hypothetical protein